MNKGSQTIVVGIAGVAMIGGAVWLGLRAMPSTPGPNNADQTQPQTPAAPPTPEERLASLRQTAENQPGLYYAWQPYINALLAMDRPEDAMAACAEMREEPSGYLNSFALEAGIHARRGEVDEAIADLEVAYLNGEGMASSALLDRTFAPIAQDPKFTAFSEAASARFQEMFERSEKAAAERPGLTDEDPQ